MAYAYKTIGSTTAAVASLLALGTALWWQRTPAPVEIPRPQDEAEIMHATLERLYGMEMPYSFVNTNGTNVVGYSPNATTKYPPKIRDAVGPNAKPPNEGGGWGDSVTRRWISPTNFPNESATWDGTWGITSNTPPTSWVLQNSVTRFWAHIDNIAIPWNTFVTGTNKTWLSTSNIVTYTTNIISVTTNDGVLFTSTSVISGLYAADIFGEGSGLFRCEWTAGTVINQNNDGTYTIIDEVPDPFTVSYDDLTVYYDDHVYQWVIYGGVRFYTGWIGSGDYPLPLPSSFTPLYGSDTLTADVADGVVTNYQYTTRSVLSTNTSEYDAFSAGKTFPFERDGKSLYWSTNAYNDMARALAMMQYQIVRNGSDVTEYGIKVQVAFDGTFDTVTSNITETITTNWSYEVFNNTLTTEAFEGGADLGSLSEYTREYTQPPPASNGTWASHWAYTLYISTSQLTFSNAIPFGLTNVLFLGNQYEPSGMTDYESRGWRPDPEYTQERNWWQNPNSKEIIPYCPPYGVVTSAWHFLPPTEVTNLLTSLSDEWSSDWPAIRDATEEAWGAGGSSRAEYYPGKLNPPRIPSWRMQALGGGSEANTFKVLFQSLTNYPTHSPAR